MWLYTVLFQIDIKYMYQSVLISRVTDFGSLLIHFMFPRFSKDRMQYFVDYR